jgi:hypothetical protein
MHTSFSLSFQSRKSYRASKSTIRHKQKEGKRGSGPAWIFNQISFLLNCIYQATIFQIAARGSLIYSLLKSAKACQIRRFKTRIEVEVIQIFENKSYRSDPTCAYIPYK